MEKWKTAIREAQTFSRMHVLLGMLDACIKWDMSAENARCKVCRKKGTRSCPTEFLSVHLSALLRQCVLVVCHSDSGCNLSSECQNLQ